MSQTTDSYPTLYPAPQTIEVSDAISLRLSTPETAPALYAVFDANKDNLGEYADDAMSHTLEGAVTNAQQMREYVANNEFVEYEILRNGHVNGEVTMFRHNCSYAKLGYWRNQDGTRDGMVTRSVARVAKFGFEGWGLEHIVLEIADTNKRSQAVAMRLGAELRWYYFREIKNNDTSSYFMQHWELRP